MPAERASRSRDQGLSRPCNRTTRLPSVAIVIPACNEAAIIADKVRNLAALDYPSARCGVVIACDGCSDETAARARLAAAEAQCRHLRVDILEFARNRGKLAILNEVVPRVEANVIALSDASALISIDALLIGAGYFISPCVGVVCATYRLLSPATSGKQSTREHQARLKQREAAIGAPLGAHGAFYMFGIACFANYRPDTINDDFILPMNIVLAGYRSVYDPRIGGDRA